MTDRDKRLKRGVFVKVKSTGRIAILGDIQEMHNRYQLRTVSGWQYGIDDLEYLDNDAILSVLEQKNDEIMKKSEEIQDRMQWARDRESFIDSILSDREKLIEGLRFYATLANYFQPKPFATPFVEVDRGQKARDILKQIGVDINV